MTLITFLVDAQAIDTGSGTDPYQRYVGFSIDSELTGEWWKDPTKVIGLASGQFYWIKDLEVAPGVHNLYYAISSMAGYKWVMRVTIGEESHPWSEVDAYTPAWVSFKAGEEPKKITARLVMPNYNPWEKTSEVVPQPLKEMEVTGVPDKAKKGQLIEITVVEKGTTTPVKGAEVTEDSEVVTTTDDQGHASWNFRGV